MPKSRAKRKLRKRVESPDGKGDGDNNEHRQSIRPRLWTGLDWPDWRQGDRAGRGLRLRGGKSQTAQTSRERGRAVRCDAMRYVRCNAMRCDLMAERDQRIDSAQLDSSRLGDRPGRDGQGERERLPALLLQSVTSITFNHQSNDH